MIVPVPSTAWRSASAWAINSARTANTSTTRLMVGPGWPYKTPSPTPPIHGPSGHVAQVHQLSLEPYVIHSGT
jgi:hypothetical protein